MERPPQTALRQEERKTNALIAHAGDMDLYATILAPPAPPEAEPASKQPPAVITVARPTQEPSLDANGLLTEVQQELDEIIDIEATPERIAIHIENCIKAISENSYINYPELLSRSKEYLQRSCDAIKPAHQDTATKNELLDVAKGYKTFDEFIGYITRERDRLRPAQPVGSIFTWSKKKEPNDSPLLDCLNQIIAWADQVLACANKHSVQEPVWSRLLELMTQLKAAQDEIAALKAQLDTARTSRIRAPSPVQPPKPRQERSKTTNGTAATAAGVTRAEMAALAAQLSTGTSLPKPLSKTVADQPPTGFAPAQTSPNEPPPTPVVRRKWPTDSPQRSAKTVLKADDGGAPASPEPH
ncbi:MAG: hypothetical protein V4490_07685 [Pseudomonadota bacterium]